MWSFLLQSKWAMEAHPGYYEDLLKRYEGIESDATRQIGLVPDFAPCLALRSVVERCDVCYRVGRCLPCCAVPYRAVPCRAVQCTRRGRSQSCPCVRVNIRVHAFVRCIYAYMCVHARECARMGGYGIRISIERSQIRTT